VHTWVTKVSATLCSSVHGNATVPLFISGVKTLRILLRKELMLEMRQKHALAGVLLYVMASAFVCYLSFGKIETAASFGGLLWLTGLFTAFNAMQKAFASEGEGTQLYLYTLMPPRQIILSKAIYNALMVAALNLLSVFFFKLFFGTDALEQADIPQFLLGLLLGSTGLGISLTFISALAYKSGAGLGLVSILGFPVVIPMLITITRFSTLALEGAVLSTNGFNLLVLLILNGISLILALVLFPYMWRD
jgi:heme exporter protein B